MGGHGALVTALRHPARWQSVSAFAPISHPSSAPWGEKAFTNYLGDDRRTWAEWDAAMLMARRSEEHTSELQSLMRISYAVFCLKKKKIQERLKIQIAYSHNIQHYEMQQE